MESSMKEEDSFQPVRSRRGKKRQGQPHSNAKTTPTLAPGPYSPSPDDMCAETASNLVLTPVKDDTTLLPSSTGADLSEHDEGEDHGGGSKGGGRDDDHMEGEDETDKSKARESFQEDSKDEKHLHRHKQPSEESSVSPHHKETSTFSSPSLLSSSRLPNSSSIRKASRSSSTNHRPPSTLRFEVRRLLVPQHRLSPLRKHWTEIVEPLVTHLKLQVRMNTKRRCIELRCRIHDNNEEKGVLNLSDVTVSNNTSRIYLQKGNDFVKAFLLGFELRDAIALLRLDDLFIESFEIKDVKRLSGDHLSRCLARLNGREGKTKYAIENSTRTRLVFADTRIHILGSFENIKLARHSICSLILGTPPGKVYNHLRTVTRRLAERL
ncbi:pre-rrna-processing protein pno1 [Cystoisospora suis]|uniref:Pre-rrna-processing protein pno1 n=1 Tax=Cystoisospora suis TaxID=483139 RepID=A0A2C6KFY1_9APIC|nr:pre-rrna-processing protein pno1 [Cystoisospora suis]